MSPEATNQRASLTDLDALSGEWGTVPSLLYAVSNFIAAEAERRDSDTDRRACAALRRVADALSSSPVVPVRAGDLTRHILDALDLLADVPETRFEQGRIEQAITGWFAASDDAEEARP